MANVPISNLTTTWNNVSTTFTGVKLNVTDTASAAGSLLMDLQVGGASRFNVTKGGAVRVANGSPSAVAYGFASDATTGLYYASSNDLRLTVVGFDAVSLSQTTLRLQSATSQFGFGTGAGDLFVARDAADTLAQRRGVNAQTFRLYNTFTDASNYERGFFGWSGNVLRIGVDAQAGTGAARNLELHTRGGDISFAHSGAPYWKFNLGVGSRSFEPVANNLYDIGNANQRVRNSYMGGFLDTVEMTAPAAPAANGVRIFAEDDGAGKTRLMALFATGAAVQIAIEP
jgi:hypothetical protein